jgi:hypothetical protein
MKQSRFLRLAVLLAPWLLAAAACDRPEWEVSSTPSPSGGSSLGGSGVIGTAGTSSPGGTANPCGFDRFVGPKPIFGAHTVNSNLPGRQELYALVNDSEAEALRAGAPLVPPAEPMAVPDVVKMLDKILPTSTQLRRPVIEALKPRFGAVRRAWPNPWALRLVGQAGSEHMNLLRIVLRDEAWLARVTDGSIAVTATNNATVSPDVAAADPGRVAAIYYEVNERNSLTSGVDACEEGRREYVLGSDEMVQEWSLGTEDILARLEDDLTKLEEFFNVSRNCATADRGSSFRSHTVCTTWKSYLVNSEYTAYQWSLATPNELYKPSPQNLASLIEALQGDRFEADDPYVVAPDPPPTMGGAGGEGGAGGGAGGAP